MRTELCDYMHDMTELEGYLAFDETIAAPRPGVLVVHEWWGRREHVESVARRLAGLGYVALALDLYGKGRLTTDPTQAGTWMTELTSNPSEVRGRFEAGAKLLRGHAHCDADRIAAIGYCMGGSICLDMARLGQKLSGVTALHAGLESRIPADQRVYGPPILVCHGDADPFVPPVQVYAFQEEMRASGSDWQIHIHGGARHAFTNPAADKVGLDALRYDPIADRRSWEATCAFLAERFEASSQSIHSVLPLQ